MSRYTFEEQKLINNLKSKLPHICYYCNRTLTSQDMVTVDHKTPLSRGGLTTEENLVIACCECNSEKDNMTEEEYKVYKQKQREMQQSFEYNDILSELLNVHNNVINRIEQIKTELTQVESQIKYIQEKIMFGTFNASEGYTYAKQLKELLNRQRELSISKDQYKNLKTVLHGQKDQIQSLTDKIVKETYETNRVALKKHIINKTIRINENKVLKLRKVSNE
jgi:hypothetical protein